jgi:Zn-dependent protease with chaperone function
VLALALVPLVVSISLSAVLPRLTGRLRPAAAARMLVVGAVTSAATGVATLGLLAWFVVAAEPQVAALGRWRPGDLLRQAGVPVPLAILAALALAAIAIRMVRGLRRNVPDARAALVLERRLPSRRRPPRLVLVDDPEPVAHAVTALPGCGGHIVVSRVLWDSIGDQALRRAVLEHERAHLRHHHGMLLAVGELAALVNPLLGSSMAELRFQLECWADEDAAAATSRATTAEAVATVALAGRRPLLAMGFDGTTAAARVQALLAGRPQRSATPASLVIGLLVTVAVIATMWACHDTELLFEALRRLHSN